MESAAGRRAFVPEKEGRVFVEADAISDNDGDSSQFNFRSSLRRSNNRSLLHFRGHDESLVGTFKSLCVAGLLRLILSVTRRGQSATLTQRHAVSFCLLVVVMVLEQCSLGIAKGDYSEAIVIHPLAVLS